MSAAEASTSMAIQLDDDSSQNSNGQVDGAVGSPPSVHSSFVWFLLYESFVWFFCMVLIVWFFMLIVPYRLFCIIVWFFCVYFMLIVPYRLFCIIDCLFMQCFLVSDGYLECPLACSTESLSSLFRDVSCFQDYSFHTAFLCACSGTFTSILFNSTCFVHLSDKQYVFYPIAHASCIYMTNNTYSILYYAIAHASCIYLISNTYSILYYTIAHALCIHLMYNLHNIYIFIYIYICFPIQNKVLLYIILTCL
jgi:hypothetical protein